MSKPIDSMGPRNAKIMVIGEAPGADEERTGLPFQGLSGNLLRECLASSGIDPETVFYTNLCRYRPPANELKAFFSAAGLPNSQVLEGLGMLAEEIAYVKPNVIIPLGNFPLKLLTGKGAWKKDDGYTGITTYRGTIIEGNRLTRGAKCVPTYHPSVVLRNYSLKHILRADLARAASQSHFPEIRHPPEYIVINPEGAEREAWINWLVSEPGTMSPVFRYTRAAADSPWIRVPSDPFITADIEGSGSVLLCVGFTRHADVAVVLQTFDQPRAVDEVRGILLCGIPLCFQNGMFDASLLEWHHDIPCMKYIRHDTLVGMHVAYTEFPKDLGFIGTLYTEEPVWFDELPKWKEVFADPKTHLPKTMYYNGKDVRITHQSMVAMLNDELTDPVLRNTYDHEIGLINPLWQIGKVGVKIDQPALATLRTTLEAEYSLFMQGIASYNGGLPVNVKSSPQVAKFLYGHLGISSSGMPKTPGGAWKMDDTTLATLMLKVKDVRQRNAIDMVRKSRERVDLVNKFCDIELDEDGRMRCHYDPAKTLTGRLASRKFNPTGRGSNLQNVPKDTRIRSLFIADSGCTFVYADLKSAESLVVAHITGDSEMLRLHSPEYMSGGLDGHKYVASFLLDKPIELITKEERYLGKRVRHAGNYGMSWFKLLQLINADAQVTGVSINAAQAKVLVAKYRQLHAKLPRWWDDISAELRKTHTLHTLHGRRRIFYDRPDAILPEAIAYVPQGTVAQTLNMGLLRLDSSYQEDEAWMARWDFAHYSDETVREMRDKSLELRNMKFQMLLQVHDAIGFQIGTGDVDDALEIVQELMAIPMQIRRRGTEPYTITIPVEIQIGQNWGEHDEKKNPTGLRTWHEPSA